MVRTVGGVRSGSVVGRQLLLFAALLFGIFTMHTVGHPAEHADPDLAAHAAPVSAHTGPAAVSAVGAESRSGLTGFPAKMHIIPPPRPPTPP